MENNKYPIEEQQIIQQKIKIPTNFIELGQPKKYWGSTEGLDKLLCERYAFKYDGKSVALDITKELSDKLSLKEDKNHSCFFYVNKSIIDKKPDEFGGITVDKEKDILIQIDEITDLKQKQEKYGNEILEGLRQINLLKKEINRLDNIVKLSEKIAEKELKEKVKNAINEAKRILQQTELAQESAKKHALNRNSSFIEIWDVKETIDKISPEISLLILNLEVKNFYEENN